MTKPVSFDEIRLWASGEADRIRTVQAALVEEGCLVKPDDGQLRRAEIADAVVRLVDQFQGGGSISALLRVQTSGR